MHSSPEREKPSSSAPPKIFFLPGASGDVQFWRPVSDALSHPGERVFWGWPGFGPTPPDPAVKGIEDLVARVVAAIDGPTALVAQSMGGVIALRAALARPDRVTRLVLTATSGGIDLAGLGAQDWRPGFYAANPSVPSWFGDRGLDLTEELGSLRSNVLLLWGDADPISPVAVGRRLASLIPRSTLHVFPGGTHDLAATHAAEVAPVIDAYLA